jgi:tripartite-type tricarboxylate transporter receptor subunit TctC
MCKLGHLRRLIIHGLILSAAFALPALGADYYASKTVRVIQPFGSGGAFDTVARLVTRHLNKHLPGQPDYVVESMPGAGGLVAMNHLYNRAKPDGLTMGFLFASLLVDEAMGSPGVQFSSDEFEWLAAPSSATPICSLTAASGIKSAEEWKNAKKPPRLGAISRGADLAYSMPKLLETQAGFHVHIIVGHKGGNPALKLAAERGEIDGFCGSLESTSILFGDALKDGTVNGIIQFGDERDPELPNVPLAREFLQTPDGADLIKVAISGPQRINRAFAFPPKTPKQHVDAMRKALLATLKDPELLEEAKQLRVNMNPVPGDEVERIVKEIASVSPETVKELSEILK